MDDPKKATAKRTRTRGHSFDNIFSSQRPLFSLSEKVWNPPADVYETSQNVVIKMEVAGLSEKHLDIQVDGNSLIIQGCRDEMAGQPKENYHLMEIRYGAFERVFALPFKLNSDEVQAQYQNGFLVVSVAKKPTVNRRIEIEVIED